MEKLVSGFNRDQKLTDLTPGFIFSLKYGRKNNTIQAKQEKRQTLQDHTARERIN